MTLSQDGTMLVTFCNSGSAKIWDLDDFKLLRSLRDEEVFNTIIKRESQTLLFFLLFFFSSFLLLKNYIFKMKFWLM